MSFVKIITYVPKEAASKVREGMAAAGAGQSEKYEAASFSSEGIGRFRPLPGAKPAIGAIGRLEEVEEERIEVVCRETDWPAVVEAIKHAHPYEEPVIEVLPLLYPRR